MLFHLLMRTRNQLTWMCLQSWPLAGRVILLKVIGHLSDTLIAVCSTMSSAPPEDDEHREKFLLTADQSNGQLQNVNLSSGGAVDKRSPPASVTRVRFPHSASHLG